VALEQHSTAGDQRPIGRDVEKNVGTSPTGEPKTYSPEADYHPEESAHDRIVIELAAYAGSGSLERLFAGWRRIGRFRTAPFRGALVVRRFGGSELRDWLGHATAPFEDG
jgi:hypothetical protein